MIFIRKRGRCSWHLPVLCLVGALAAIRPTMVSADPRLPHVFGSDMVLQRDKPVAVWGWSGAGEAITVRFAGQEKTATAGADGKWKVTLEPMIASGAGRELIVAGASTITLRNVVVGDVWVCSGDFGAYWEMFGVAEAEKEIAAADRPGIRLLKIEGRTSNEPLDDIEGAWRPCTPASVTGFSALGYFFGREIHQELNVPVGVISAAYRYSVERGWISAEGFRLVPELSKPRDLMDSRDPTTAKGKEAYLAAIAAVEKWLPVAEQAFAEGKAIAAQPRLPAAKPANDANYHAIGELSLNYNGMIHPLTPMAIRGVIWSLDESGAMEAGKYRYYLRGLVEGWRKAWGRGDFPFYLELMPAIGKPGDSTERISGWTRTREEEIASTTIANTGMVVTYDVSDFVSDNRNRQDAGRRFALLALAKEYGQEVEFSGPVYREHKVEGDRVAISYDHVGRGLIAGEKKGLAPVEEIKAGTLKGFALAGADGRWHVADARIEGDTVVLHSAAVAAPVAVRYATASNPSASNLYNRDGLPAVPFRVGEK